MHWEMIMTSLLEIAANFSKKRDHLSISQTSKEEAQSSETPGDIRLLGEIVVSLSVHITQLANQTKLLHEALSQHLMLARKRHAMDQSDPLSAGLAFERQLTKVASLTDRQYEEVARHSSRVLKALGRCRLREELDELLLSVEKATPEA
jgi:hypothetical protein